MAHNRPLQPHLHGNPPEISPASEIAHNGCVASPTGPRWPTNAAYQANAREPIAVVYIKTVTAVDLRLGDDDVARPPCPLLNDVAIAVDPG